jgi:competence protein ComEC
MTDKIYFRPIIPLLLSMISGILLGTWFPGRSAAMTGVVLVCVFIVLWNIRQRNASFIPPIILFTALGYLSIQSWVAPDLPSHHIIHYADTHAREIVGIIDTSPFESANRQKFILHTETIRENKRSIPVSGKIRVTVAGNSPRLHRGDKISLISKIRPIRNFNNPGGFDYKKYMLFRRVMATAYVSWKHLTLVKRHSKVSCRSMIDDARRKVSGLIETTRQGDPKDVLKALLIGDRNAISKKLRKAFNRAGVGHLLAISGLHIGIVATVSFLFFQKVLSHIRFFLWNAWTKKGAVVLSFVPVWLYGLLAGMSPSTQRAVIMVMVFLVSFLLESEHDPVNTLALAAMAILVVHPPSLFSISFQLSFSAVLAILYGLSRVRNPWAPHSGKTKKTIGFIILKKFYDFFLVSLFAILGTLPLLMLYFNQISLVGLFANVIVVPLIGFIVVPVGLLSVFLYPLTILGASYGLDICSLVLEQTLYIVNFFAELPFAAIKTITPTVVEICCFYVLFWAILNLKHRQKSVFLAAALSILVLSADTYYWLHHRFWHDDLRISIIDVGHGNASLLELPKGYTILIDGGGFSDNAVFDVGARIVAPFLWRRKIKTVDTMILSHPNSDHINGLIYIAENFHVKNVWTNNQGSKNVGYQDFLRVIKKNRIHMPEYEEIFGRHRENGVCIDIFYPPVDFIDRQKHDRWRDANNNSLVIKVTFGSKSVLFPGDIKARAEEALVAMAESQIDSTVLIAPHHGSKTSNSRLFIEKVCPETVIISSGWKGRFGFPHPSVLKRYRQKGCRVLGTSRHGAITLLTDGKTLSSKTTLTNADL